MAQPASKIPKEDRPVTGSELLSRETGDSSITGSSSGGAKSSTASKDGGAISGTSSSSTSSYSGGLYKTGDTKASLKTAEESPEDIDEEGDRLGRGYTPGNSSQTQPGRLRFKMTRRKAIIGIGGTSTVGLVFGFFSVTSGPAQIVQLSEILQREFRSMNSSSTSRLNKMLGDAGARDIGETRLGALGRKYLRQTLQELSDTGIEFKTNSVGAITETHIDSKKLAGKYSELNGMSDTEKRAWLAQKYGLSEDQIAFNGKGKFTIDARDFGIKATSLLKNNSISLLANGDVETALKSRVLAKYFNLPSLFHPIELAKAAAANKAANAVERRAVEEQTVSQEISDPVETNTAGLRASLKDKLSGGFSDTATKILAPVAALCSVRSAADDAVAFNHAAIVVPAALEAVRLVSIGEQVKNGHDENLKQVGATVESLHDSTGSIWQGKALRSISGESATGPDLPGSYGQAFSNHTTADNIRKVINVKDPVLGIDVTGAACSKIGLIIQAGANILSFIVNIPDGDSAAFASYAAQTGVEAASGIGLMYFFEHQFVNLVKDKAVVPPVLSGPLGGNLAAYGARAAGNLASIASGGIALTGTAASTVSYQQEQQDQQQFRSESFFARTFNMYDYRSLAGKVAQAFSPSITNNVATMTGRFAAIPSNLFSTIFSPFMPHTQAANSYDWGFPQYGIPSDLLDDPSVANPYDNAAAVGKILDKGDSTAQDLIQRAQNCFGVTVSNSSDGWDVVPHNDVNPDDSSYTGANCDQYKGDPNWAKMIMFVTDTITMKADACYQGDDQSCSDLGPQNGSSASSAPSSPSTPGSLPTGSSKDLASQLLPFISSGQLFCGPSAGGLGPSNCADIQNTAKGTPLGGNCAVDSLTPHLLGLILGLVRDDHWKLGISAMCSDHHPEGDGPYAGHSYGSVADFSVQNTSTGAAAAADEKFVNDAAALLTQTGGSFGQIGCHPTYPALQNGTFTTFDDTCNHQHIRAAP